MERTYTNTVKTHGRWMENYKHTVAILILTIYSEGASINSALTRKKREREKERQRGG